MPMQAKSFELELQNLVTDPSRKCIEFREHPLTEILPVETKILTAGRQLVHWLSQEQSQLAQFLEWTARACHVALTEEGDFVGESINSNSWKHDIGESARQLEAHVMEPLRPRDGQVETPSSMSLASLLFPTAAPCRQESVSPDLAKRLSRALRRHRLNPSALEHVGPFLVDVAFMLHCSHPKDAGQRHGVPVAILIYKMDLEEAQLASEEKSISSFLSPEALLCSLLLPLDGWMVVHMRSCDVSGLLQSSFRGEGGETGAGLLNCIQHLAQTSLNVDRTCQRSY